MNLTIEVDKKTILENLEKMNFNLDDLQQLVINALAKDLCNGNYLDKSYIELLKIVLSMN